MNMLYIFITFICFIISICYINALGYIVFGTCQGSNPTFIHGTVTIFEVNNCFSIIKYNIKFSSSGAYNLYLSTDTTCSKVISSSSKTLNTCRLGTIAKYVSGSYNPINIPHPNDVSYEGIYYSGDSSCTSTSTSNVVFATQVPYPFTCMTYNIGYQTYYVLGSYSNIGFVLNFFTDSNCLTLAYFHYQFGSNQGCNQIDTSSIYALVNYNITRVNQLSTIPKTSKGWIQVGSWGYYNKIAMSSTGQYQTAASDFTPIYTSSDYGSS